MSAPGPSGDEQSIRDPGEDVIVETPVLNKICEANAPTPGDFTDKFLQRVRTNVRQRRTENAISRRIANNAVSPVVEALEVEVSDRVKQTIEKRRRNK